MNITIGVQVEVRLTEPFRLERDSGGLYRLYNYRNLETLFLGDAPDSRELLKMALAAVNKVEKKL
jgi:hypothetical protein